MTPHEARALLGVRADCTADQLRSAFRARAKRLHPDNGGVGGKAFSDVVEAHDLLREHATTGDDGLHDAHDVHGDAHTVSRVAERTPEGWSVHVPREFVQYSDVVVDCGGGWTFVVPFRTPLPWRAVVPGPRGNDRRVVVYDGRAGLVVPGSVTRRRHVESEEQ